MSTPLVDLGFAPAVGAVVGTVVVVPAQDPAPPPGEGPEFGKASPVALVVIILLGLATVFLIRSMTKRIRRLPASFDDPPVEGGAEPVPAPEPEPVPGKPVDASGAGDAAVDRPKADVDTAPPNRDPTAP